MYWIQLGKVELTDVKIRILQVLIADLLVASNQLLELRRALLEVKYELEIVAF